mmetsp:Transcript_32832/g.103952  ORF Transcript_32832/g.103952 Transcript_32832/m.103952 type:complete len:213 (+) Transcript_32832:418-1056(+)
MRRLLDREGMNHDEPGPNRQLEDLLGNLGNLFGGQGMGSPAVRGGQDFRQYQKASEAFGGAFGLNQRPAMEFVAAIEEARKLGLKAIPFDKRQEDILRDLQGIGPAEAMTAVAKFMGGQSLPPPQLARFAQGMFGGDYGEIMEKVKDRDFVDAMIEWTDDLMPSLSRIIVHERDQYMYEKLVALPPCTTAVAVVGVGHVSGIERRWNESEEA